MTTSVNSNKTTVVSKASHYRWVIIGLAFLITIINYLDRAAIAYAIEPIKHEFGLNETDFGYIAAAFGIGYTLMTVIGGIMVDHVGPRSIWAAAALLWSSVTAMLGLASGVPMFILFRLMLGLAEGPHFPALTRTIADWLPASEKARASALGLVAVPLASAIGAPLISRLILHLGWKSMFFVLGSFGIFWAAAWLIWFRNRPEESSHVNKEELAYIKSQRSEDSIYGHGDLLVSPHANSKTTWKYLLTNPSLLANDFAFFAFGYTLFFALNWLPDYLHESYGMNLKQIGDLSVVPWLTAAAMVVAGGHLSDYLYNKTGSSRISRSHMIWICQLLSALSFIPVVMSNSLPVALTGISLGLGFAMMPNACFYTLNNDLAHDRAGTSLGVMGCCFSLATILSPIVTGHLTTITGNFNLAIILLIGLSLASVLTIIFFQHPDKYLQEKKSS